jgi:hypothetical protein
MRCFVCNKCPAIIRYGYCTKCLKIKKQMLKKTQNLQEEMELKKKNDMKLEYMQILQEEMELKKKNDMKLEYMQILQEEMELKKKNDMKLEYMQNLQEDMELKKKNDMKLEYMQNLQEEMELKKKTNIFAHKATLYNFSELELIESITTEYANSPSSFDTILLN